eukprot:4178232-Pyramimonas_sp.AAC.1
MGVGAGASERSHWHLRWTSPWATKRVRGVPECAWVTHAGGGTRAFVGAPYGATKRVRGVQPNGCGRMRAVELGPSVEATKRVR